MRYHRASTARQLKMILWTMEYQKSLEGSSKTSVTRKFAEVTGSHVTQAQILPQPKRMNWTLSAASASKEEEAEES